jgi:hypothetical protein
VGEAQCQGCRFWTRNEQRAVPPEPETHSRFLGMLFANDGFSYHVDQMIHDRAIVWNQSGDCHFLPRFTDRHETDWCGQFELATQETSHDDA